MVTLGRGPDIEALAASITLPDTVPSDAGGTTIRPNIPHIALDLAELPALSGYVLGEEIARGGMGTVRIATQRPIDREVAVKSIRIDRADPRAVTSLVREAIIAGRLEHPNIVPVHALGLDPSGEPVIVMKKVEGVTWETMLRRPNHAAWQSVKGDRLTFSLNVLAQVASAIEFAHDRGILHRDIKPANVMIGRFGEVYVVDWGLAIRIGEDLSSLGLSGFAGTPGYVAPEMLETDAGGLGAWSDVFLLGATLHHVLTGKPRNTGSSLAQILQQAWKAEPHEFPESVPAELGAIVNRACRREPQDRFPSAEAFRSAILEFVEQRSSIELSHETERRLRDLEAAIARPEPEAGSVLRLFGECRFGFRQVLAILPDHAPARSGLDRAISAMIRFELARKNASAARALLPELSSFDPELVASVEALERAASEEKKELHELRSLKAGLDVRRGGKARVYMLLGVVAAYTAIGIAFVNVAPDVPSAVRNVVSRVLMLATLMTGAFVMRKTLLTHDAGRRLVFAGTVAVAAVVVHSVLGKLTGDEVERILIGDLFLMATASAVVGATMDRRVFSASVWLLACAFVGAMFPEVTIGLYAGAMFGLLLIISVIWMLGERS
jgi:eukaryotic-like serine/threonine-protein kinase